MTITVQKMDFLNAIKAVKTVVGKNNLQPILSTIHIKSENGGLTLTATDCTNTARAVIEAHCTEPFDICVNASKLDDIVSRLDDNITIDLKESAAVFKSGKTVFKSLYMNSEEFPKIEITLNNNEDKIILSKDEFIIGVNKTIFAVASYENRNIIANVCFSFKGENGYEMAATDGNRLSQVVFDTHTNKNGKYVITPQALNAITKTIKDEVEIYFNDKDKSVILFKTNNFVFVSRLCEGEFPPYEQLIPKTFKSTATIDRAELLKALDKVSIMANERTNITKFVFTKDNLQLITECPNVGDAKDDLEIDYTSTEELLIAFNYKYVIDCLKSMDAKEITFNLNGNLSAVLIKGDNGYTHLIMPVQLK